MKRRNFNRKINQGLRLLRQHTEKYRDLKSLEQGGTPRGNESKGIVNNIEKKRGNMTGSLIHLTHLLLI